MFAVSLEFLSISTRGLGGDGKGQTFTPSRPVVALPLVGHPMNDNINSFLLNTVEAVMTPSPTRVARRISPVNPFNAIGWRSDQVLLAYFETMLRAYISFQSVQA